MSKSILFTGYYGMNNFGDDLFSIVCSEGAKLFSPLSKASVLSPPIKTIEQNCVIPSKFASIYTRSNNFGSFSRLFLSAWHAHKKKHLIFGGGSLFSGQPKGVMKFLAHSPCLNFAALGVSLGPFQSDAHEKKTKEFIKRFKYLTLRDNFSYQIAKSWNLDLPLAMNGDLAGAIPQLNLYESFDETRKKRSSIGVSMCNYELFHGGEFALDKARCHALSTAVIKVAKNMSLDVDVFSLNNHPFFGDNHIHQCFIENLERNGVAYKLYDNTSLGALNLWQKIAQCSAFVSIRLHGGIAAYLNQVPFALVEYHQKCKDFLDDIGQRDIYRLGYSDTDVESYVSVIEAILGDSYAPPSYNTDLYADRAVQHFSFIS